MPLSSLTNMSAATSRSPATKSPCTRAQLRRNQALTDEASSSGEAELPEELLSFVLTDETCGPVRPALIPRAR